MKKLKLLVLLSLLVSCTESELIPKPPTYQRLELPDHEYNAVIDDCPYSIHLPEIYTVKPAIDSNGVKTCNKDIDLGPLNGAIHFSYIEMTHPISEYVNFVNDKVDEHKIMATSIKDKQILRNEDSVFCTFFELQGNVASPFQFYLTDSTSKFVSGVVYFNSRPNYDSLKPTLDYLKIDLDHLINTFKWKN
jgi:gliding motility-associated lipoprotein GldD